MDQPLAYPQTEGQLVAWQDWVYQTAKEAIKSGKIQNSGTCWELQNPELPSSPPSTASKPIMAVKRLE
ncbi:MAG: hypothetical protein IMW91_11050 [Firmicutes bacterium]|nr:hypothetical protein [Bacillota bacterium]